MTIFVDSKSILQNPNDEMIFGWPALLEILGMGALLENLPKFDETNEIYNNFFSTIENNEPNNLMHLFEQLFAEILTQVSALPEMQTEFFLKAIQNKHLVYLTRFENAFQNNSKEAFHDLILYIAWDRICVGLAIVFEQAPSNVKTRQGLAILQKCLIDSYQHIMGQAKTIPSFFRLMEAFYAFYMREENLQSYTDGEWLILCQGARALRSREKLSDVIYIDAAITITPSPIKALTVDSDEKIISALNLAKFILQKIKQENPKWLYRLCALEIFSNTSKKTILA